MGLIPVPGSDALGDALGGVAKDAWGAAWNRVAEIPQTGISAYWSDVYDELNGDPISAVDLNGAYRDPFIGWTT